jgi:ABC-type glutathione transport system ATPase component
MTEEAVDTSGGVEEAKEQDVVAVVAEEKSSSSVRRLHSATSSGMESSVLRFKDVNFVVGKGDKQKNILTDVSGTVKWGHVLAIMGPSGAGKVSSRVLERLALDDVPTSHTTAHSTVSFLFFIILTLDFISFHFILLPNKQTNISKTRRL